jgi:hypothetical protein
MSARSAGGRSPTRVCIVANVESAAGVAAGTFGMVACSPAAHRARNFCRLSSEGPVFGGSAGRAASSFLDMEGFEKS